MIDYLVHLYKVGTQPFQTLSTLPDVEALKIMEDLYLDGSVFWERFENPKNYRHYRKTIEQWLHKGFVAKGGKPQEAYPIYMILGQALWGERKMDGITRAMTQTIQVPLSIFGEGDVSFTYPDSMVSWMLDQEKNTAYYQPNYHGKVFTRSEMLSIVEEKGLPEMGWETNVPDHLAHYIEAQVWNHKVLLDFKRQLDDNDTRKVKRKRG